MDSSKSSPLQEENLASFRKRNTILIAILFSFIISLALIITGFVIFLIVKDDFTSHPPGTNPAVNGFCSVAESPLNCINSLSSSDINPILFTDPIHVYILSLESAVEQLSRLDSFFSSSNFSNPRIDSAARNCSPSLRVAKGRLDTAMAVIRVDPDNETRIFEQSGDMVALIVKAIEDLRSCGEEMERVAAVLWGLEKTEKLLRYSMDYLMDCDLVNRRFRLQAIFHVRSRNKVLGFLALSAESIVFVLQYFVWIFLFIWILLRCKLCCKTGSCHRV